MANDEHVPAKPQTRARTRGSGCGRGGTAPGSHLTKARFTFTDSGPGRSRGYSVAGEARRERDERIAEEMRELYYDFATDQRKPDAIRLAAADHLLDRLEGRPVARVLTGGPVADDLSALSDDELLAEMRASRAKRLALLR